MVARLQYLRFCLSEMYVNVFFVMFVQCSELVILPKSKVQSRPKTHTHTHTLTPSLTLTHTHTFTHTHTHNTPPFWWTRRTSSWFGGALRVSSALVALKHSSTACGASPPGPGTGMMGACGSLTVTAAVSFPSCRTQKVCIMRQCPHLAPLSEPRLQVLHAGMLQNQICVKLVASKLLTFEICSICTHACTGMHTHCPSLSVSLSTHTHCP